MSDDYIPGVDRGPGELDHVRGIRPCPCCPGVMLDATTACFECAHSWHSDSEAIPQDVGGARG